MIEKYSSAGLAFRVAFIYSKYQGLKTRLGKENGVWIVEIAADYASC